jgi:tripartite-type tricarboxylate transporter receptor subunit TctC
MIRRALLAVVTLGLGLQAGAAVAQSTYPNRPVKIIVPTVAGGTVDVVTRFLASHLSSALGGQFYIDNRSGAGNTLGSREAARADPDGYTLLMSSASGQVISPLLYKEPGYDPVKSFAPVVPYAEGSIILVVNPSLPFKSVADVVAHAKANPGKLNYGSAGTGTLPHLIGELFKVRAGVDLVHIPYRGGALSIADLIAGNINLTFEGSGPLLQHIQDGRLRALAVMGPTRIPELPDTPSIVEAGYPEVQTTTWTGLFAPVGTDAAVIAKLNTAINARLRTPELQTLLAKVGNQPKGGTPEALTETLVGDIAKWGPVVKQLNLKAD